MQACACIAEKNLVLLYLSDVKSSLKIHQLASGTFVKDLKLSIGAVGSLSGRRHDNELFYSHASYLNPGLIYRYSFETEKITEFFETKLGEPFDKEAFETKQVFYESKDGTKIPMFIVARKNVALTGENPAMLYGYGGFSVAITPAFSPTWLMFMKHLNGIIAVANIRGGG